MKKKPQKDTDLAAYMVKIQEQLAVLEQKLDSFMTKSLTELARAMPTLKTAAPQVQAASGAQARPADPKSRPMFQATCAECGKECEVPFRPSGDRPVYCKECWARRRSAGAPKSAPGSGIVAMSPAAHKTPPKPSEPPAAKKKKPAASGKAGGKKKTAAGKKGKKK